MNPLLRHADLITRCRSRGGIEIGVVTAINELLGARHTAFYKIFMPPGDVLVGLSVEINAGDPVAITHDDGFSWPEKTGSIENYPELQACFGGDAPCVEPLPDGGTRLIMLLRAGYREPYGFLQLHLAAPPTLEDLDILNGFAALQKNLLAMLDYSETDTLTRLLNRKTFDEYLINILASIPDQDDDNLGARHLPQRRHPGPEVRDHWLGVMDIDHFKSINDRFGHLIGDEVLILLANLMRDCFRVQDKLFRFGGEEFVALLRPAEFAHAHGTFERFRTRVEAFEFPQVGHVTVSIGFTRIKLGDTPPAILDSADEALYWAKEHGRNQCHAYETLIADGKLQRHAPPPSDIELF
jgi:diguanylate cyclase (GGDEF)-like protein